MNTQSLIERVRIGAAEVQVAVSGTGLLPTADGSACCCCCCSSSGTKAK
ncbi:MAG: hypothetical protein ABI301_07535 [Jatrophihabitantaceae bacterium]